MNINDLYSEFRNRLAVTENYLKNEGPKGEDLMFICPLHIMQGITKMGYFIGISEPHNNTITVIDYAPPKGWKTEVDKNNRKEFIKLMTVHATTNYTFWDFFRFIKPFGLAGELNQIAAKNPSLSTQEKEQLPEYIESQMFWNTAAINWKNANNQGKN